MPDDTSPSQSGSKATEQRRGQLTERIKARSKELLGYEVDTDELRLMPYIQYVMVNEQRTGRGFLSPQENEILSKWKDKGYTEREGRRLKVTKAFWDIISELIFLGYVDLSEGE